MQNIEHESSSVHLETYSLSRITATVCPRSAHPIPIQRSIQCAHPVRESAHTPIPIQAKNEKNTRKNAVRRLRPRPTTCVQVGVKRKGCNPSVGKKEEIQDMDGHREHRLAEVNTSAASERERSKKESTMKNARNHPHSNHMVEDKLELRAALRQ
jgi:hypothetical protein